MGEMLYVADFFLDGLLVLPGAFTLRDAKGARSPFLHSQLLPRSACEHRFPPSKPLLLPEHGHTMPPIAPLPAALLAITYQKGRSAAAASFPLC